MISTGKPLHVVDHFAHGLLRQVRLVEGDGLEGVPEDGLVGIRLHVFEKVAGEAGMIHFPMPQPFVESLMNAMEVPLQPFLILQRASMIGILDGVRDDGLQLHAFEARAELGERGIGHVGTGRQRH